MACTTKRSPTKLIFGHIYHTNYGTWECRGMVYIGFTRKNSLPIRRGWQFIPLGWNSLGGKIRAIAHTPTKTQGLSWLLSHVHIPDEP